MRRTTRQQSGEPALSTAFAPRSRIDRALDGGTPLPAGTRGRMERALGHRFADVRVHAGDAITRELGGDGLAVGNHVAVAAGAVGGDPVSDALLAHELAHVVQSEDATGDSVQRDAAVEREADHAAAHAAIALHTRGATPAAPPLRRGVAPGVRLRRCGSAPRPSAEAQLALDTGTFTRSTAEEVLSIYEQLEGDERQAFVEQYARTGRLEQMMGVLRNTSYSQLIWGGRFAHVLRDLLQRVQRLGVLDYARGRGLEDRGAIARAQAAFMDEQNRERAMRGRPADAPPPSREELQEAHRREVERTSIAPQTDVMTPERERQSTEECHAAVRRFVAWAQREHPELGITEANLRVDVRGVFQRGRNVIAFEGTSGGSCGGGGTPQAVVGEAFTRAVRMNPAYAMPTVIHELYGHREYGKPELGMEVYREAVPHMETYGGTRAGAEWDAYGYQETELYAVMRGYEYQVPTEAEHAASGVNRDLRSRIAYRIGLIRQQYEPAVAESLVRGLWMRLRMDPRMVERALEAFRAGVREHFADRAEEILR